MAAARRFRIEYPTGCPIEVTGVPRWAQLAGEPWPAIEAQAASPPGTTVLLFPWKGGRVIDLESGEVVWPR